MKKIIAVAAVLALSACAQEEAADAGDEMAAEGEIEFAGEEPGFEAVAPGTYEVEHANGDIDNITIHPGMTFSRIAADGEATGGTIFMQDGKTCFVVEGVEGHNCFVDGPVQEDGSMQTTADDGDVATVRPIEGDLATAGEA